MADTARTVIIKTDEATLYAAITELYNTGRFEMIAEDGTAVTLVSKGEPCYECGECIPAAAETDEHGGSLENKHHAPSCSLYDPEKD